MLFWKEIRARFPSSFREALDHIGHDIDEVGLIGLDLTQKPLQPIGAGAEKDSEQEMRLLLGLPLEIGFQMRSKSCATLRFMQGGRGLLGVRERAAVLCWMSPMPAMANRSLSHLSTAMPLSRSHSCAERRLQRRSERRSERFRASVLSVWAASESDSGKRSP